MIKTASGVNIKQTIKIMDRMYILYIMDIMDIMRMTQIKHNIVHITDVMNNTDIMDTLEVKQTYNLHYA